MDATELKNHRLDAVVIGASAGGIEALSVILSRLPSTLRVPLLIVLHLPRERPSLLVEIFSAKCTLPVREAMDKEPIEPGTVYFAPPDYHLLVEAGPQLALSVDALVHYSRPSIDVLFESAADVYGEHVMGIVLSGANQDGAAGLQAISRAGGVTAVQTPESAHARAMPEAALKNGAPDFLCDAEQMAVLLGTVGVGDGT
jgi:two-component system chemotaxis response regulator CheB